jgi:hypothetical protein
MIPGQPKLFSFCVVLMVSCSLAGISILFGKIIYVLATALNNALLHQ